jgi:hypothetical protein
VLSKASQWRGKNGTFSKISAVETGLEHRRTQWLLGPKYSKSPDKGTEATADG